MNMLVEKEPLLDSSNNTKYAARNI